MTARIPAVGRIPATGRVPVSGRVPVANRNSDDDPARVGGLLVWLDATRGIQTNGGNVAAWGDQSGNGNHATQATPGNQPAFSAAGFNGMPCVDWSGGATNRGLVLPVISYGARSWLAVIRATAGSGYFLVHNSDATDGEYIYCLNSASYSLSRGGLRSSKNVSATWLADGVAKSMAVTFNGTHATHISYRLGVLDTSSTALANDPGTALQAGNVYLGMNQTGAGPYRGAMAEVLLYDRALTAAEVKFLEAYFRAKWKYI